MTDLVNTLREWRPFDGVQVWPVMNQAADRIAQLEAAILAVCNAIDRARESISPEDEGAVAQVFCYYLNTAQVNAAAALQPEDRT